MKRQTKLTSEQQQNAAQQNQQQEQTAKEFASPEELLRYDASQTNVPPAVSQRLQASIGPVSPAARSWWQRLFGGAK